MQTSALRGVAIPLPSFAAWVGLVFALTCAVTTAWSQTQPPTDLSGASLEDLMDITVTSVSRKEEKLSRAAAAVYVITQDDIRSSGATTIPDVLRAVPGLDVAQINSNTWAISARGFNGQFANKLLVLIDGRTVYDPSNSGVYWDSQDMLLEDIERIEVIRGPGATIWGTNAMNGVINIISKDSRNTQGGLLSGGAGFVEQGFGSLRYGGRLGRHAYYRVFGKYFHRGSFDDLSGGSAADGWSIKRGGFRADWDASDRDLVTIQGDIYGGTKSEPYPAGPSLTPPFTTEPFTSIKNAAGGDLQTRWLHTCRNGSQMSLQVYFDRISRTDFVDPELRNTVDVDFQHHFAAGTRHDFMWGAGYRVNSDDLPGSFRVSFLPRMSPNTVINAFLQDEVAIIRDKLWLTAGTKIEHNDFTGFDVEPSLRLLWTLADRHTFWAAYSSADRVPARSDLDLRVNLAAFPGPGGVVSLLSLFGNPKLGPEHLDAYEFGYRFQPDKRLSLDIAGFYNKYNHLRSTEPGTTFFENSPSPPHILVPLVFSDKMYGITYGAEASAEWRALQMWTLRAGYAWFVPSLKIRPSSEDSSSVFAQEGESPRNQVEMLSRLSLPRRFEFDTAVYYVGHLASGGIPGYTRLDAQMARPISERVELGFTGQNLLTPRHAEFNGLAQSLATTEIKRSFYGKLTWRF